MSALQPKLKGGLDAFNCISWLPCQIRHIHAGQNYNGQREHHKAEQTFKASKNISVESLSYFCERNFKEKYLLNSSKFSSEGKQAKTIYIL